MLAMFLIARWASTVNGVTRRFGTLQDARRHLRGRRIEQHRITIGGCFALHQHAGQRRFLLGVPPIIALRDARAGPHPLGGFDAFDFTVFQYGNVGCACDGDFIGAIDPCTNQAFSDPNSAVFRPWGKSNQGKGTCQLPFHGVWQPWMLKIVLHNSDVQASRILRLGDAQGHHEPNTRLGNGVSTASAPP